MAARSLTWSPAPRVAFVVPVDGNLDLLGGRGHTYWPKHWPESSIVDGGLHLSLDLVKPSKGRVESWWSHLVNELKQ